MKHDATKSVRIGILTYNEDRILAEKYLLTIGVPCGFVVLNQLSP